MIDFYKNPNPALILPTRDGNLSPDNKFQTSLQGFDPTYKGWKLDWSNNTLTVSDSFDPTYKGWKRVYGKSGLWFPGSFDPTYKGWKLCYEVSINNG